MVLPWFSCLCWMNTTLLMCLIKHLLDFIYGCDVFSPALNIRPVRPAINRKAVFPRVWTNEAFRYTHPEEVTHFLIHVKQRKAVPCVKCNHSALLFILQRPRVHPSLHEHSPVRMSLCLLWLGLLRISLSALCKDTSHWWLTPSRLLLIHMSHLFLLIALICRASGWHTGR